ncbi:hypothetical protein [Nonomuraea sp. SBT364]|uniref:hypothetical protein n=1 Tax=Nonomuraea sp. SBT364 TaxID=1580530 RepID=UPI00066B12C5|nr:hypothetical protein [Nonomuraea sp. SBT364]
MRVLAAVAAFTLVGCTASGGHAGGTGKRWQQEFAMAACMADRGFKYRPSVPAFTPSAEVLRRADGHYPSLLKYRQKYGYTVFSGHVYPTTEEAAGVDVPPHIPNEKYIEALSPSQQVAYREADRVCYTRAIKAVFGKDVTGMEDLHRQHARAHQALDEREFDNDPELVALAHDYAVCLRSKGYPVPTEKPGRIGTLEQDRFLGKLWELGRRQYPDATPDLPVMPRLTPDEARPYLREEITSALDDLECGKAFFSAFNPRHRAASARLQEEWGLS